MDTINNYLPLIICMSDRGHVGGHIRVLKTSPWSLFPSRSLNSRDVVSGHCQLTVKLHGWLTDWLTLTKHVVTQPLHYKQDVTQGQFVKWSTAGLNSVSFSQTGCFIKSKESSLPTIYLWQGENIDSCILQGH